MRITNSASPAAQSRQHNATMKNQFASLFGQLERALATMPSDLFHALAALPAVGALPSPWLIWTLLALVTNRQRQLWALQAVREQLPQMLVPPRRHTIDFRRETFLPQAPEWNVAQYSYGELFFHNRVSGERITPPPSPDERCLSLQPRAFIWQLGQVAILPAMARLKELYRDPNAVELELCLLARAGLLVAPGGRRLRPRPPLRRTPFQCSGPLDGAVLSDMALAQMPVLERFLAAWENSAARLWLAAAVGDWPLAQQLAASTGDAALLSLTKRRAGQCRRLQLALIRCHVDPAGPMCAAALHSLYQLGAAKVPRLVATALRRTFRTARAACRYRHELDEVGRFIVEADDPRWCKGLFALLRQLAADTASRPLELPVEAWAGYLAKHGYHAAEAIELACRCGDRFDDLVLIALEHAPQTALAVIRRALSRSGEMTAFARGSVFHSTVAILAAIDQPWSRRELVQILVELGRNNRKNLAVMPVAIALSESRDAATRQLAVAYEQAANKRDWEVFIQWLDDAILKVRERVMPLRAQPVDDGSPNQSTRAGTTT